MHPLCGALVLLIFISIDHNKEQCFFDIMEGYSGKGNFDNTLTQRGSQLTQETCKTRCLNIATCEAVMIQEIAGEPRCYYYRTGTVEPIQSDDEILFVRQCPSGKCHDHLQWKIVPYRAAALL